MASISNPIRYTFSIGSTIVIVIGMMMMMMGKTTVTAQLNFTPSSGKTYKVGFCNICGGDGKLVDPYQQFKNGQRTWTCGYAQTTVQDVADGPFALADEKLHCRSTSLVAQQGGCECTGGNGIQDSYTTLGEECYLCGRNEPIANPATLVDTVVAGSHQCQGLAKYMQGGMSANLCPQIKKYAFQKCCTYNVDFVKPADDYTISFNSGSGNNAPKPAYNTAGGGKNQLRGDRFKNKLSNNRGGSGSF